MGTGREIKYSSTQVLRYSGMGTQRETKCSSTQVLKNANGKIGVSGMMLRTEVTVLLWARRGWTQVLGKGNAKVYDDAITDFIRRKMAA
jgi:hypothetical protein